MSSKIDTIITPQFVELAADQEAMAHRLSRQLSLINTMRAQYDLEPNTESHAHLGRALQRGSEHLRLLHHTQRALSMKSECLNIWASLERDKASFLVQLQMVQLHLQFNHLHDALDDAQRLLATAHASPAFQAYLPFVLEALGCALGSMGRMDEAREMFVNALERLPAHGAVCARIKMCLALINPPH